MTIVFNYSYSVYVSLAEVEPFANEAFNFIGFKVIFECPGIVYVGLLSESGDADNKAVADTRVRPICCHVAGMF